MRRRGTSGVRTLPGALSHGAGLSEIHGARGFHSPGAPSGPRQSLDHPPPKRWESIAPPPGAPRGGEGPGSSGWPGERDGGGLASTRGPPGHARASGVRPTHWEVAVGERSGGRLCWGAWGGPRLPSSEDGHTPHGHTQAHEPRGFRPISIAPHLENDTDAAIRNC